MTKDRIEKTTLLRAPLGRVWQAISDSSQFGEWFGLRAEGPFVAGETVRCTIVPVDDDSELAAEHNEYAGVEFEIWVDEVIAERKFAFRWLAHGADEDADPETQPKTLVTFRLEKRDGGVQLTLTESGFDALPGELRTKAFTANDDGWTQQLRNIEGYVASG